MPDASGHPLRFEAFASAAAELAAWERISLVRAHRYVGDRMANRI
jgi:hypothetical protein